MPTRRIDPQPLDDVSRGIIRELQEDGRRPYATIGRAVGLSEAAVRQRVQRLLDSGAIRILAVTDAPQVGFARQATIGVRVDGDLDAVTDELVKMPEITELVIASGSFDLLVSAVCLDDRHLLELVAGKIRQVTGVRSTESFVHLQVRKHLSRSV